MMRSTDWILGGLAVVLGATALASPATAQTAQSAQSRLVTAGPVTHLGRYDLTTGEIIPPGAEEGGTADPTLVYDQSDFLFGDPPGGTYLLPTLGQIDMDWGILAAGGPNAIVRITIGYGTTSEEPVDLTIRLHRGTQHMVRGEGVALPLTGLPGLGLWTLDIDLPKPLLLSDGPIGYSYESSDPDTGPILLVTLNEAGTEDMMDIYDSGGNLIGYFFIPGGVEASVYMQMYGVDPADAVFDPRTGIDRVLSGRESFSGSIDDPEDVDVLRYHALAGETLKASVRATSKDGLQPHVELVETGSGQVTDGVLSGSRITVEADVLETVAYELRISAENGSSGGYRVKFGGKLPKAARKPPAAPAPLPGGGALLTFDAKPGALFTARVRPDVKTDGEVQPPVLEGPLGPVEMGEALTRSGNNFSIKKLPLAAFGQYVLRAGDAPAGVGQSARGSVRTPRGARSRLNEFERILGGTWVREDFVTPSNTNLLVLDPKRPGPMSQRVAKKSDATGTFTAIRQLRRWAVKDVPGSPDVRQLSYTVGSIELIGSTVAPPEVTGNAEVLQFTHPLGDPDTILFLGDSKIWHRDLTLGPATPTFDPTSTAAGQIALRIQCVPDAVAYEIFRAPFGTAVPSFPYDIHTVECIDGEAIYVDLGALPPGPLGGARYQVRSVDASGNRSLLSDPRDVFAP